MREVLQEEQGELGQEVQVGQVRGMHEVPRADGQPHCLAEQRTDHRRAHHRRADHHRAHLVAHLPACGKRTHHRRRPRRRNGVLVHGRVPRSHPRRHLGVGHDDAGDEQEQFFSTWVGTNDGDGQGDGYSYADQKAGVTSPYNGSPPWKLFNADLNGWE